MNSALVLAAALALSPAQGGALNVTNIRQTYGELGPTRSDHKYQAFDYVFCHFDIDGLKATADGKVEYSMGVELVDSAGKVIFKPQVQKQEMLLPMGAAKLPAFTYITIGPDMKLGTYTLRTTIVDVTTKANKVFDLKFELVAPSFGIVSLHVSKDIKADIHCGMTGVVGQTVYVNFGLVGFGRTANKETNAAIEFRVLDASGQPINQKPIAVDVPKNFEPKELVVPFQIMLPLNREGSFTVEIKAADKIVQKQTALTFPIRVYPASK